MCPADYYSLLSVNAECRLYKDTIRCWVYVTLEFAESVLEIGLSRWQAESSHLRTHLKIGSQLYTNYKSSQYFTHKRVIIPKNDPLEVKILNP